MRKLFTTLLLTTFVCVICSACSANAEPEQPAYDPNIDYMSVMILSAWNGDTDTLSASIEARNAKVLDSVRGGKLLTVDEFLGDFEKYAGFSLTEDYLQTMKECCMSGDFSAGLEAEQKRNKKIETLELDAEKVHLNDLYLLSKIITAEAGSSWLSMEWKMSVGEVVLNRVDSQEFPNTIEEVLHRPGQYANVNTRYFETLVPFADCVDAAANLLTGDRVLNNKAVVFQSGAKQGSGVHTAMYDSHYGYTYFCYSNYPELYQ